MGLSLVCCPSNLLVQLDRCIAQHGLGDDRLRPVESASIDAWLVVSGTGQRIPVEAESVDGGTRKIHAVVLGWNTDSPRLKLQPETGS